MSATTDARPAGRQPGPSDREVGTSAVADKPRVEPPPPGQRWRMRSRLDFTGLAMAIAFLCLSLTPSLLPRSALVQGIISGILATTGYLVGVTVAAVERRLVRWRPGVRGQRIAWRVLWVVAVPTTAVFLYQGTLWQRDIHRLMGVPAPAEVGYLGVPVLAGGMFLGLVVIARTLRAGARALGRLLGRWIPPSVARVTATVAVTALAAGFVQGVVENRLLSDADASFRALNDGTPDGVTAPADPARSGSAASYVPWHTLGRQGRNFVVRGPRVADLERFSGQPAVPPIRVYAGLASAATARARAALAVRELERTGGFDRKVLCVITTTGTGWVDRHTVDPIEYMYNGDSALVAMQYSYLPSWLSFLVDRERAREAGRELFNAVYAVWSRLPVGDRPKLLVLGESLGAYGAEAAFSGLDDLLRRTDGVLLIGPPNDSVLWREFTADRDPGTPEVLPQYGGGDLMRFAGQPSDLTSVPSRSTPHLVYLQHASDPVVWWSPGLIVHRPDWLTERRGRDVLPAMRWYPFVTFWQPTADLIVSLDAPSGHGHSYGGDMVATWARVAPPDDWTAGRTAALARVLGH
jgi:uncharacterized membrane protein